ncbi:MAG: sporulation integral membrane protein YtvI [Acetanaerobacterium sp.]
MNIDKVQRRRAFIINTLYWAIIITLVYLCLKYVAVWIMPFIIGFLIAYSLKPVVEFLHRKLKGNRKVWAVIVIIFAYSILGALLWLIGSRIAIGVVRLFEMLPDAYTNNFEPALIKLNDMTAEFFSGLSPTISDTLDNVMNAISDFIINTSKTAVSWLAQASTKLPTFLLALVFTIMSSVFISLDFGRIRAFIVKQLPAKYIGWLYDAKSFVTDTLLKYMRAYLILMTITFVELSIGLTILRIESSILVALLIALVDILPVLGTGGILIPWIVIEIVKGNFSLALGLLIVYAVVIIIRNIIEPRIVGRSIGLNPLLTLMCMYIGLVNFGFVGMIVLPILLLVAINFQESGKIRFWKT